VVIVVALLVARRRRIGGRVWRRNERGEHSVCPPRVDDLAGGMKTVDDRTRPHAAFTRTRTSFRGNLGSPAA
jgi:hypothetical protein